MCGLQRGYFLEYVLRLLRDGVGQWHEYKWDKSCEHASTHGYIFYDTYDDTLM